MVLHEQWKGNDKRLRKMQRIMKAHPGVANRNPERLDRYFDMRFRNRTQIVRALRRLADYPIDFRCRGDEVSHVRLRRRGWMTCNQFVTAIEKGEFPLFTIRKDQHGDLLPVRVPWVNLFEDMLGLERSEEVGVVYNRLPG